jgi:hypothetical protein
MFLFLRSLRARRIAALTSAMIFSFGGYWFYYANNLYARAYIYIPILLYLVNRAAARRIGPWTFLLALAIAGSVLVGMPEATFLVWLVVGIYVVYRVVTSARARRRAAAVRLAVAGFLGLAMAAPLIALFLQYERLSFNTHKGGSTAGKATVPAQSLIGWLGPKLNGVAIDWTARAWVGGTAVALACLCAAATTRFLRARQVLPIAIGAAGLAWKIYGLPGASAVGTLPIAEQIRWVAFGTPVLQVLLAILAGLGFDALLRRQIVARRLLVVSGVVACAFAWMVLTDARVENAFERNAQALLAMISVATVLAVAVLARTHRTRQWVAVLVSALVVVQLVALVPEPAYAARFDPFGAEPWFQWVRGASADRDPGTEPARVFGLDGKLYPETASAVRMYDPRMLDALYVERYYEYVKTFLEGRLYDRYVGLPHNSPELGTQYLDNPMFDLLGVRYLLSGWSVPGTIVGDLEERLPRPGTATGHVAVRDARIAGITRPVLVSDTGSTAWVPAPEASDAVAIRGQVVALRATSPVTFEVVREAADGTVTALSPPTTVAPGAPAQTLDVPLTGDSASRYGFRVLSADPTARGVWYDLAFADANGNPMSSQYRLVGRANLTSVWENLEAVPRAFVVHDVAKVADAHAARARMLRGSTRLRGGARLVGDFDPRTTAVVETDGAVPTQPCSTPASVSFDHYSPQKVRLVVDAACPGLLVLTDTYYPGWKATVDGRSAAIVPTDLAFRGVAVPAGRSVVEMKYEPGSFRPALLLAALAFLAGLVLCVVPLVRRARHGSRPRRAQPRAGTPGSLPSRR